MDSYDPRLHPSHSMDPPPGNQRFDRDHRDHRDRRPPPPRSRHDDFSHFSDRATVREHRGHDRAAHTEHDHGREGGDWRLREYHHRPDDRAQVDYGRDGHGRHARYTEDRYRSGAAGAAGRDWERERQSVDRDAYHGDQYRRPHQEGHYRDRHRHQEPSDHQRAPDSHHHSDRRRDASRDRRPVHPESSTPSANPPPPPSLQTLATTQPNLLPSPTSATTTPAGPPPPLPSELHALAEQGPMLHHAETAATKALSRQLPPSLMPDLLQDVDEILDLLMPVVLQSNQTGDVDQVVAVLESRVKSQLKMARYTTKHLKTLREHPLLSGVLDPVIDSEVRRVAEGFKQGG